MRLTAFPWDALTRLDLRAALDILIIAILLYYILKLLGSTRALQTTIALALLALVFYSARWARLEMLEWLLANLMPYVVIALIVLFQPEIRRALAHLGRAAPWRRFSSQQTAEAHDDVVMAVSYLSQQRIGALLVLERDVSLKTYMESGVPLDAVVSYDLLVTIFHPESPLHDGAAILRGNRIAAAACFLPLSLNPMISNQLGTRHRAAIGVTEESDAVAVVVSEQTGAIGLAFGGAIELNLAPEQLRQRLADFFVRFRSQLPLPAVPLRTEAAGWFPSREQKD